MTRSSHPVTSRRGRFPDEIRFEAFSSYLFVWLLHPMRRDGRLEMSKVLKRSCCVSRVALHHFSGLWIIIADFNSINMQGGDRVRSKTEQSSWFDFINTDKCRSSLRRQLSTSYRTIKSMTLTNEVCVRYGEPRFTPNLTAQLIESLRPSNTEILTEIDFQKFFCKGER